MNYSTDDLGWLCNWGGHPLLEWEGLGFFIDDPAIVDFVDYWLWKEAVHARLSGTHWQGRYEGDSFLLHHYVQQERMQSDFARVRGMSYTLPP